MPRHLKGDEKGEAQVFCDRLFSSLRTRRLQRSGRHAGVSDKERSAKAQASQICLEARLLLEMKKAAKAVRPLQAGFDYWLNAVLTDRVMSSVQLREFGSMT